MKEDIYDFQVAPLLRQAAEICRANGLSMVAVTEFAPNCTGITATMTGKQGIETHMTYLAAKARGNADILIGALLKNEPEGGSASYYLDRLQRRPKF